MNRKNIVLTTVLFVSATSFATGTLQIGEPTVEGTQVVVPVILGGDTQTGVSALDFRLQYNPDVLKPVSASAGAAAATADKQVMANVSTPGEYIVVMMGMNQTTCASGEVAKIVMQRTTEAQDTDWSLGIRRPTLSALDGSPIESEALPYEPGTKPETPTEPETPNATPQTPKGMPQEAAGNADGAPAVEYVATPDTQEASDAQRDAEERLNVALAEKDKARAQLGTPSLGNTSEDDEQAPEAENGEDAAKATPGSDAETEARASRDSVTSNVANDATTVETNAKPSGAGPDGPIVNPKDSRAVTSDRSGRRATVAVAVIVILAGAIAIGRKLFG